MPKFGGFLGFNTGLKVCAGVAVGYAGTIAIQHWHTSESSDNVPPLMREERDERQKKFEFEVQQRSEQLNKKEQTLKALEETLAKREAALKEERSTFQYMQAKNNAPSESETVAVQRVREEVPKVVESTTVKVAHPDPVVSPTDDGPRRPQVFDGGNREPVVSKDATIGVTRPLYFSDPSFATSDGRYNPTIPRGDTPPHLADTGRRRYTNLKLQHVVSFRATKDGWSLETPDEESNGAYAPATGTDRLIASTASGAPRKSEKGDATVVTLYGHGPKPPSDGRSAVAEAERNAFNKERLAFAQQKEAFEREKSKKEKELADKKQALDDREAELELRDNAADLFDLEDREMQYAKRQKAKYKANTKVRRAENFDILRQEKTPYKIEQQNEESMTIKAKSKESNVIQPGSNFKIAGKKQLFENLELKREELFVPRPKKEPLEMSSERNLEIFPQDMPKKRELFIQSTAKLDVKSKPKQPNKEQRVDNLFVNGDEWQAKHAGSYEPSYAEVLAIIPEGRHPGDNVLSVKKIENSVKKIENFQILSQPKVRLLQESRNDIKIKAKQSEPLQLQRTNDFLSEGREGMLAKDYQEEKSSFSLTTEKKAEKANVAGQVANFTIADENVPVEGEKKTQDSETDIANVKSSESLLRLKEALKTAKKAAGKNKDVKKTGKGLKKSTRKKLKVDASSKSTQTDFKPKKTKTKEKETSTDEPLLLISKMENIVAFEGEKSFGDLVKVSEASDCVYIPAKPKETPSVIEGTGRVFLKAKKIETKEEETAVGTQVVDFDSITGNNFSVPGQVKALLQTSNTESMKFSAPGKPDNKVSPVDTIEFAGEEPKKTENAITSDRGFKIQAKPSAKVVKPSLTSQQFNFSLPAEKKVGPTITDTFKTPLRKHGGSTDGGEKEKKEKKSQTKREEYGIASKLNFMYDPEGLADDLIEKSEESDEDEKQKENVSAFMLDKKPVSENKISHAESVQILKKKEKPLLISTKSEDFEVKAMQKPSRNLEISKMQITAEAQAVGTKESATETQKPELSIASNTVVSFGKNTLPKKEFIIDGPSQLLVAAKKTQKTDASFGTEPPQFEISKTKTVTAEAKKVEKQDSETETETETEAPTPSVIANEVSFGYSPKIQAKSLSVQNNDKISLAGEKSFGELKKNAVTESMYIPAKPKPTLKIGDQGETLLIEAQPKPESEIHSVEALSILRQEKPENQIKSEVSVEVLPKSKPTYVKTNGDRLFIKGNDANWYLQTELDATKVQLEGEKETSEFLKTELETTKVLQQAERVKKLNALKMINAVSESVLRTKDTRNAEVQTAEKVPLFKEKNELFIKGEKHWIIDSDEDELDKDELDKYFENIKGKEKPLRERQHEAMADIVRIWVSHYISDKGNTESVVSKILAGKDEETKEVKEKLEKIEENLLRGNDYESLTQEVRGIIAQYISSLNDTPIDAVETPKVAVVNKKPGWSVLEIQTRTADDIFKGNVQSKFSRELCPSVKNEICFIGKSAVTMDGAVQTDESRRFLGNLCSKNVMRESFVDDKLSLMSQLEQKELKHKKLKSDYEDLQKNAKDMLDINNEYHNENEKIKIINREQNQEIEVRKKQYEDLLEAFEEFRNLVTGCGYSEFESEKVLNEAKAIALEAMEGLTNGTLRGEKAEELLKRYGETAERWSSVNHNHKCDNSVCLQRQRFMDSLAFLLQSRLGNRGADAFKVIRSQEEMIKGGVSKTSKPFEVSPATSFGLDADPKIKSEKEAQKEQLSKLTTENEALKSRLKEESDRQEALKKTNDDTEPLKKENNDLKEKSKAFEKENNNLKAKVVELEKENKDLEERLKAKGDELNFLFEGFSEAVGKEKAALEKNLKEKNEIIAQQNADLEKQKNEFVYENTLLKLQNLINEPAGGPTNNKENAEKKEDEEKKFKKPTDPDVEKEVNAFLEKLKRAGDNLKKLESLQKELKGKPHLKQWVSDGLEKAIKDAKEREEKYKKEEEEAEREMNDLMRRLEGIEDVDELKKGIAKLLDYAQDRLSHVPVKFGLEAAGSFVKGSFVGDIGRICGENAEQMAQKNVAKSFVNTVSSVQENIMKVWKRMTVVLKPKALPMEDLKKATVDKEEERIKLEANKRKQKAVDERDKEIKNLKDQLKETKRNYKVKVVDLESRLQLAFPSKSHMRGRTEVNLLSKTNGSSIYNLTGISELDESRYSTPNETQGKNKLRNRSVRKPDSYSKPDNYSRDSSRSLMRSNMHLQEFEYSDLCSRKYNESQMKSDETFGTLYKQGRISFTDQSKGNTFLKDIEETADEYGDSETTNLSPIKKVRERMMGCMRSVSSLTNFTWNPKLNEQYGLLKKGIQNFFKYVEEENKRTSGLQKSVTEKKLKTEKLEKKTRSKLNVTTGLTKSVVQNLGERFSSEDSGLKKAKKGKTPYKKIKEQNSLQNDSKGKKGGIHYKKIDPKISSRKKKQEQRGKPSYG